MPAAQDHGVATIDVLTTGFISHTQSSHGVLAAKDVRLPLHPPQKHGCHSVLSGNWCGPYTLFDRTVINGSLKLFRYALTIISAAALLAEYGFVGARMLVSLRSAAPIGTSP